MVFPRGGRYARHTITAVTLVLVGACATPQANVVQVSVGRGTRPDIVLKLTDILNRQGYTVQERLEAGGVIQYRTSWETRAPFEDEKGRGAVECRTRLTFEARRGGGETYTLTLRAENTAERAGSEGEWGALPATPMFRDHIRDVAEGIALELDVGVRTR